MDLENSENYKIFPYIDKTFNSNPITTVDFKRHLLPSVALNKVTHKLLNGRPSEVEYHLNGELMARIRFIFVVNSANLVLSKTEVLEYTLLDGSFGLPVTIRTKAYDHMNPEDLEKVVNERVEARNSILANIKGTISGVLQSYGHSMAETLMLGAALWSAYSDEIQTFVEFGTEDWKSSLIALDLSSTSHSWLAYVMDAQGTRVVDFMVTRLSY